MGNIAELNASNQKVRDALKQIAEGFNTLAESLPFSHSIISGQLSNIIGGETTTVEIPETAVSTPAVNNVPPPETQAPVTETTVETQTPATNVRVDKHGVPWDERIHSGKNAEKAEFNKDGEWKRRRGVLKEEFDRITAELKGSTATTPAVEEPVQDSTPPSGSVPPPQTAGSVPPPQTGSVPPPQAGTTPPPSNELSDGEVKSQKFFEDKDAAIAAYKILVDEIGVAHEDLCDEVSAEIGIPVRDDQVQFGGATYDQTTQLRELWEKRVELFRAMNSQISDMRVWAGDEYQANVNSAVSAEIEKFHTQNIADIHYASLLQFKANLTALHAQWLDWARANGKVA